MSRNKILRNMKRTKMQEIQTVQSMDRNAINHLLQQQDGLLNEFLIMQKNVLATINALKRRGLITDLDIQAELTAIEEMERMKQQALIIDPKKGGK